MNRFTTPTHRAAEARAALCALLLAVFVAIGPAPAGAAEKAVAQEHASTININTADAPALADALYGVGLSRAEDIVRYREQFGPFTTVEQLGEVKGIGSATVEKNRARIKLD